MALAEFFKDKPLPNYLGIYCFTNQEDYFTQEPVLPQLGKLKYAGPSGLSEEDKWVTEDGSIAVTVNHHNGLITWVMDTPT